MKCKIGFTEFHKKAKWIMEDIKENKFQYSELAMYHVHMEASRASRRLVFKRPELVEVKSRLEAKYPLIHHSMIPPFMVSLLPKTLLDFINTYDYSRDMIKVEWFYSGLYHYEANNPYRQQIHFHRNSDRTVYSKAVDTCGFSEYNKPFKMWTESVDHPLMVVSYMGLAYRKDVGMITMQTMKIMTMVLDYQHMISITCLQ